MICITELIQEIELEPASASGEAGQGIDPAVPVLQLGPTAVTAISKVDIQHGDARSGTGSQTVIGVGPPEPPKADDLTVAGGVFETVTGTRVFPGTGAANHPTGTAAPPYGVKR